MSRLILLRHGQSVWNLENRFTGWVDVDLTPDGEAQARRAGALMKEAGLAPDRAYTSVLKRAIRTLWLSLETLDRVWIPVEKTWRLNERHYGALAGLNKAETAARHGEEQVRVWRRSYDTAPPPLDAGDADNPCLDPRYSGVPADALPKSESLRTTLQRVEPHFSDAIRPRLEAGETVIVAAHGNSLRALVKLIFGLDEEAIMAVEVPTGNPMVIDLDGPRVIAARYLDEARAQPLPPCPAQAG